MSTLSPEPGAGPPVIPPEVIDLQKQGQAVLIWIIGSFCIFVWECVICLPSEYRLIWKKPMNTSSLLYLCNRYFGFVEFCLVASLSTDIWTPSACKHIFFFEPVSGLISSVISQVILGCRVYAIFGQSKPIGILLCVSLTAEVVLSGLGISYVSLPPQSTFGPRPPCGSIFGPFEWLVVSWAMPLFYESIAFLLTAWKAYDFWRKDADIHLFEVIWRDGLLYFFAMLFMNIANVVIFLTAPPILRAINIGPTLMFQVIISCRLVLNLKASGSHDAAISHKSKSRPKTKQIITEVKPVKIDIPRWSFGNNNQVTKPLNMDQKVRNKEPTTKNWSLPAHLWDKPPSGSMV